MLFLVFCPLEFLKYLHIGTVLTFPQTIISQFKKLWRDLMKLASVFCIYLVHTHVLIWGNSWCWPLFLSQPFASLCVSCSAELCVYTKQSCQLISFTSHVTLWYSLFFSVLPAVFPYFPLCHEVERLAFFVNAVVCYCRTLQNPLISACSLPPDP